MYKNAKSAKSGYVRSTACGGGNLSSFCHSECVSLNSKAGLLRHKPRNDFLAFTLAEVLITFGIIGVVAALTISSLVNNIIGTY